MKSQDILVLLKLVSLSQQASTEQVSDAFVTHEGWEDWENEDFEGGAWENISVRDPYSVRSLSTAIGVSKSEISNALSRCYQSGLAKFSRDSNTPTVNTKALGEFVKYGIRYVFPAETGKLTRGVVTGLTARVVFDGELKSGGDQIPVWPDAKGSTMGLAVEPLFKTVPYAVRKDPRLYAFLALVDSIRIGLPRERNLAAEKFLILLKE